MLLNSQTTRYQQHQEKAKIMSVSLAAIRRKQFKNNHVPSCIAGRTVIQMLWKIVWPFFKNFKNIYHMSQQFHFSWCIPKGIDTTSQTLHTHIHSNIFQDENDPSVHCHMSRITKHSIFCYSKRKEVLPHGKTWINLKDIILSEISRLLKDSRMILLVWGP